MPDSCMVCGHKLDPQYALDLGPLPLFYGTKDPEIEASLNGRAFDAKLAYCESCGTAQQVVNPETLAALDMIYQSSKACGATPYSDSGWGAGRMKTFFEKTKFLFNPRSVLDIGCQDGYLLYEFHKRGATELVGFEPGDVVPFEKDGFKPVIHKGFFDSSSFRNKKFDTVVALQVLEHIRTPVAFLKSIRDALSDGGQLVVSVPNARVQMESGDPGLFIHEHLIHFDDSSLDFTFAAAGFRIINRDETRNEFYVVAQKTSDAEPVAAPPKHDKNKNPLMKFKDKMDFMLGRFKEKTNGLKKIGLYGACKTTANLANLAGIKNYSIFDDDTKKQGRELSGMNGKILEPTETNLKSQADMVCIATMGFQEIIAGKLEAFGIPYFMLFGE